MSDKKLDGPAVGVIAGAMDYYFRIDDPRYAGTDDEGESLWCHITAESINMQWVMLNGAGGDNYAEEHEITFPELWDYLRQIPKTYECFCKGGE